jgi:coenzyme F420-reducing hydrogenase alpha subunit
MTRKTIKVGYLARVEGEGSLRVVIRNGAVQSAELRIFEPPRFFEGLLRGRKFHEAPDITARICGICPAAYQMSAVHALEDAFGITVPEPVKALRRLLYCGEWLESHSLHVFMLHAPDFLGYDSAIDMARDHGPIVERGLTLKKIGNRVMTLLGGREVHPINVRVGGFYKVPTRSELAALTGSLERAREIAADTVRWAGGLDCPDLERDYEFVALRAAVAEYPHNEGRLVSNKGLDIDVHAYDEHFEELHVARSTALYARRVGAGAYLVGPMARYSLNSDRLSANAARAAREAGLESQCRNPYRSIVVRAVEMLHACDEALELIDRYEPPDEPSVRVEPRAGVGYGCTEAPRGILYHRYQIDDAGNIVAARIVPPTSQNQASIEEDLKAFIGESLDLPEAALRSRCEQTVRNYDPCISCATHFLKLDIDRA